MSEFTAESTTDEVIQGVSLAGRTAVVTGASSGLGVETARVLAGAGARVLLVARNPTKLERALSGLRRGNPGDLFDTALMDLSNLDSVRSAAADVRARYPEIHLLINNAGIMACPLARTAQGFEMQFGTNHLGHFLFTTALLPSLLAAARNSELASRVVCLSSAAHRLGAFNFEDPHYRQREYNKWIAYGESKTANALFALELDRRYRDRGIRAFSVHPGVIDTELGRHLSQEDRDALMATVPSGEEFVRKSLEQGAATTVWAATAPALEQRGGEYLEDCHIAAPGRPGSRIGVQDYAANPDLAERLWNLSEQLAGKSAL